MKKLILLSALLNLACSSYDGSNNDSNNSELLNCDGLFKKIGGLLHYF